jgi:hypothetical protein
MVWSGKMNMRNTVQCSGSYNPAAVMRTMITVAGFFKTERSKSKIGFPVV